MAVLAVTVGHRTNSGQSCYVSGQICYLSGHNEQVNPGSKTWLPNVRSILKPYCEHWHGRHFVTITITFIHSHFIVEQHFPLVRITKSHKNHFYIEKFARVASASKSKFKHQHTAYDMHLPNSNMKCVLVWLAIFTTTFHCKY